MQLLKTWQNAGEYSEGQGTGTSPALGASGATADVALSAPVFCSSHQWRLLCVRSREGFQNMAGLNCLTVTNTAAGREPWRCSGGSGVIWAELGCPKDGGFFVK